MNRLSPNAVLMLCALFFPNSPVRAQQPPAVPRLVHNLKVLPQHAPDCTSLEAIVNSVTRGCETNDQKAIALYNFMRLTHYHRAYPSEPGGIPVLKEINCYGWSLCGGLHAEQSALWKAMGWDWRFVGWPGHTTVEAFYDGRWHYLDVFLKFYAWMPDPQNPARQIIAGQADLADNADQLLLNAFVMDPARRVMYARGNEFDLFGSRANWQAPAFLTCGDDLMNVVAGVRQRNRVGREPGWGGMRHDTGNYSAQVNLAPGFAITNTWDAAADAWYWADSLQPPCHTCGDKEIRNSPEKGPIAEPYLTPDWNAESYANGELSFRLNTADPNCLESFHHADNVKLADRSLVPDDPARPAMLTLKLQSPWILTKGTAHAPNVSRFEISTDDGTSWEPAQLDDFGQRIAGNVSVLARFHFRSPLRTLNLQATVQNNPFALPWLQPGRNQIHVSVDNPEELHDKTLVVTYAYRRGVRTKSYEELCLEGKEIARGHNATWEARPTVVRKTFTAAELPATFQIEIPTAEHLYPVYPRMLFVRREILSPGQEPLPLPENAVSPTTAENEMLKTLPNPLLTGTQPAPQRPQGKRTSATYVLPPGVFADQSASPPTTNFLKWPKQQGEAVPALVYLISSQLPTLPGPDALASAKLVVPVTRGHAQAPTKLGLFPLRSATGSAQDFDFTTSGNVLSTALVPQLADDAPSWSPPQEVTFDITRYVRSLLLQQEQRGRFSHHGFGLRVLPDRAVDDGWTVRVHLPQSARPRLNIETHAD